MANNGYDLLDAWEAMEFQEEGQRNLLKYRGLTTTHAQFGSIGADGSGHLTMPYALKPAGYSKDQVIQEFGSIDAWIKSYKDDGTNTWSRSAYYQMLEDGYSEEEARKGTNWYDEVVQTGKVQNHEISVTGGGEKATYSVGLGYMNREGTIKESWFRRYSLRANTNFFAVLNTISGGATARPFITHHNTLDIDMYMRIATELPLKRLIVGGMDRVYEIGRIFRNEGMDPKHNPEFTTVELYQAYTDFNGMMDLFEDLLSSAAQKILGTYQVEWQGEQIDLTPGWPRLTMHEAVKQYTGIDFMAISSDEEAVAAAKAIGVELPETADPTWGNALYETFDQKVEEKLVQPTFITMHPVDVSPLAKRSPQDPRLTERFELFICRSEMGNAFSELNDPIDQKQRFQKQVELRAKGDSEAGMMDEDYINALEYGLPPTGGLGIGIDRCVMLLTNSDTIREVILFPTMKPLE